MYEDAESDTESTSKATTSGRSQKTKLAPIQVKNVTEIEGKSELDTQEKKTQPEMSQLKSKVEIQRPKIIEPKSQTPKLEVSKQKRPQQPAPTIQSGPINIKLKDKSEDIRRPSRDQDHLSMSCHLFPRLNETNLNFHDIYWGVDEKTKKVFIRKRIVNVSKIFGFHSFQPVRRATSDSEIPLSNADESSQFKLQLQLVDLRPRAGEQIVSNVLELPIEMQQTRFGMFCQRSPAKSVLIRSNYKQSEVILRVYLLKSLSPIGHSDIPLIDTEQRSRLPTRTQTLTIGDFKVNFDSWDPSTRLAAQTDSLPDILLCLEEWIPMLATFRQLTAEVLAERDRKQQTAWITDPVMATFPSVCQLPRLVEILLFVLNKKQKYDTSTFRTVFMQYIYPIVYTLPIQDGKKAQDFRVEIEKNGENPLKLLSTEKSEPLNIFNYAVHLAAFHAID